MTKTNWKEEYNEKFGDSAPVVVFKNWEFCDKVEEWIEQNFISKKELEKKVKINKEANKEDNMISLTERLHRNDVYCEILKIIQDKN